MNRLCQKRDVITQSGSGSCAEHKRGKVGRGKRWERWQGWGWRGVRWWASNTWLIITVWGISTVGRWDYHLSVGICEASSGSTPREVCATKYLWFSKEKDCVTRAQEVMLTWVLMPAHCPAPDTQALFLQFLFSFSCYLFWEVHPIACRILVPWPEIKPLPPALEVQGLNHWTAWEVALPALSFLHQLTTIRLCLRNVIESFETMSLIAL